jgi:hypothetical protein
MPGSQACFEGTGDGSMWFSTGLSSSTLAKSGLGKKPAGSTMLNNVLTLDRISCRPVHEEHSLWLEYYR